MNVEYTLIVDSREKVNTFDALREYNIKYTIQALPVGDFQIVTPEGKVTVERKTIPDFIGSLLSGRLEDQLRRLSQEPIPGLLLTGTYSEYREHAKTTKFTSDQLIGAIASAVVKYGLRFVIWIQSTETRPHSTGIALMAKIIKKIAEGKLDNIPDRRIRKTEENPQREILRILCGVPSNVAENLLKKYNNCIIEILKATDEELLSIDGMGPGRVRRMRKLIHGKQINEV